MSIGGAVLNGTEAMESNRYASTSVSTHFSGEWAAETRAVTEAASRARAYDKPPGQGYKRSLQSCGVMLRVHHV